MSLPRMWSPISGNRLHPGGEIDKCKIRLGVNKRKATWEVPLNLWTFGSNYFMRNRVIHCRRTRIRPGKGEMNRGKKIKAVPLKKDVPAAIWVMEHENGSTQTWKELIWEGNETLKKLCCRGLLNGIIFIGTGDGNFKKEHNVEWVKSDWRHKRVETLFLLISELLIMSY